MSYTLILVGIGYALLGDDYIARGTRKQLKSLGNEIMRYLLGVTV